MSFEHDIVQWVAKVDQRLQYIPKASAKAVVADARTPKSAGGLMPVRYGNLRNSAVVSFSEVAPADQPYDEASNLPEATPIIEQTIDSAQPGQPIRIGFRAQYGPIQEVKNAFVRVAALKWDGFVAAAVSQAKALFP